MGDHLKKSEEARNEETSRQMDRRNFVRQLAGAIGGIATLTVVGAPSAARTSAPVSVVVSVPDLPWRRRIYCQFDPQKHWELLRALRQCSEETGCDIVFGDRDSPDLYAIGGFVLVLDRSEVGDEVWQEYVEMYRDDADITPCFIIDDRTDLPMPDWNFTYRLDIGAPSSVETIVEAIRQMKLEMNRRLPDLFKCAEELSTSSV